MKSIHIYKLLAGRFVDAPDYKVSLNTPVGDKWTETMCEWGAERTRWRNQRSIITLKEVFALQILKCTLINNFSEWSVDCETSPCCLCSRSSASGVYSMKFTKLHCCPEDPRQRGRRCHYMTFHTLTSCMSTSCRLLVAWVTVRPNALFPRLPSDCPQARGESSAHEAVSMLHSQKAIVQ